VTISRPFAVGELHVTVEQYTAFVRDTRYEESRPCHWSSPGFAQDGSHPVVCVAWEDVNAYVEWLARKTGKPYRLPSEAEWKYAARGRTSPGKYPRFWFGDNENDLCRYGNGADQNARNVPGWNNVRTIPCNDGYIYTSPARHYEPNAFGLYDMFGNAWQWTADCYHDSYNGAPTDGSAWTTDCIVYGRVVRGGGWKFLPGGVLRDGRRLGNEGVLSDLGFRVARSLNGPDADHR
jgi:formylglycine-generating enzyme required for sulfatase activity